ncbi:bacteriohemerythrin [Desulfitobacterium hafniense]|uniref:Hemerythrin-like domain-containing protein n=5 Tax=root TaxID=1 RepID=Q24YC9_DESHY|nr:hemerythrin family protein [Desulfitobacterium hafniense]ACL20293.1 hemerythrin-like metal-binding protein [Desulfitobacterium hafniense DCB-2]EHL05724.1 hemerythrin HHE cation binding domain protein [Desulfitobacterium hafniense DP7]KTE90497.1 hemerythrin [Desulfitobacterium hafniense]MEA5021694.1 hemerythrin family protein [Desulfitobacterium hafniense]CDX01097.1 Hemerythrin protein [Desulfitobacterium hafniense]
MIWKEKYKVGDPLIDSQHEELFSRVGSFVETLRSDKPWEQKVEKVNETLEFMKDYVVTHFADEEAYQLEIGYPHFEEHQMIHKNMVAYVVAVSREYAKEGFKEELMQQFGGKLLAWLINHVVADDQKIAEYARSKEGKQ